MTRLNTYVTALALAGAMILSVTSLSFAQNYGAPPDNVGGGGDSQGNGGSYAPDAAGGGSDASLIVRVEHLEDQIRQMTGQIQQMQFENRQLQDQLKKFEQDVDFRLQDSRGGHLQRHSEMTPASPPPATDADSGSPPSDATTNPTDSADASAPPDTSPRHGHSGDVFDPTADPNAPGAPKPLGAGESAPPPVADNGGGGAANSDPNAPLNLQSAYTPPAPSVPAGGVSTPAGTELASTQPASPRAEFDAALGYFKQKDYDNAEHGFQSFLDKNPKSRLTVEATYLLGESYFARGHAREAAEQFLKISTTYSASSRAPEAMLRLGESLRTLGAKEQACATFSEVPRKYPNASAAVKAGAEREAKRSQCGA
ncbi:MAG: tol-pal system protein YbgF [Methylovirgula sp.]